VESATFLAGALRVPELIVGLTVVAIGTSLPELATSLVAALRKESDIAVGNIVGSNIFNVASVLGFASLIRPIRVEPSILTKEMPAMLILSLLVLPVARMRYTIRRWEGALLLVTYLVLMSWITLG
jgi:cation:H+ antiporter